MEPATQNVYDETDVGQYTFYPNRIDRIHVGWLSPAEGSLPVWQQLENRAPPYCQLSARFFLKNSGKGRSVRPHQIDTWVANLNPFRDFNGRIRLDKARAQREFVWRLLKKRKELYGLGGVLPSLDPAEVMDRKEWGERLGNLRRMDINSLGLPPPPASGEGYLNAGETIVNSVEVKQDKARRREEERDFEQAMSEDEDSDGEQDETLSDTSNLTEAERILEARLGGETDNTGHGPDHTLRNDRKTSTDDMADEATEKETTDVDGEVTDTSDSDTEDEEAAFGAKPVFLATTKSVYRDTGTRQPSTEKSLDYHTPPASHTSSKRTFNSNADNMFDFDSGRPSKLKRRRTRDYNNRGRDADSTSGPSELISQRFKALHREWERTMAMVSPAHQAELQARAMLFSAGAEKLVDHLRVVQYAQKDEERTFAMLPETMTTLP